MTLILLCILLCAYTMLGVCYGTITSAVYSILWMFRSNQERPRTMCRFLILRKMCLLVCAIDQEIFLMLSYEFRSKDAGSSTRSQPIHSLCGQNHSSSLIASELLTAKWPGAELAWHTSCCYLNSLAACTFLHLSLSVMTSETHYHTNPPITLHGSHALV